MHPYLKDIALNHSHRSWSYTVKREIEVLYFPETHRAGVARGATVLWITADSAESARETFETRGDDLCVKLH